MLDRRGFLSSFAGMAGAAGALGLAPKLDALREQEAAKLLPVTGHEVNDERLSVFDRQKQISDQCLSG